MMHLADTHSFGEGQRADASFERPLPEDLQGGQTHAVPDPDLRLQCLNKTSRGHQPPSPVGHLLPVSSHFLSSLLPASITPYFLLPFTPTSCILSPPTSPRLPLCTSCLLLTSCHTHFLLDVSAHLQLPLSSHILLNASPTSCISTPPSFNFLLVPSSHFLLPVTFLLPVSAHTLRPLTRPSLSTPAIWPVAIRILSGWMAKLESEEESAGQHQAANRRAQSRVT